MPFKRILALSSSRVADSGYLERAAPMIEHFLGNDSRDIAFIPFASVEGNYPEYVSMVREGLSSLNHKVHLAEPGTAKAVIGRCDAVMTGGGNTFKLLHDLYENGLMDLIRNKVAAGVPYIGWSAGSNITAPTICTTNDMPIIEPESFTALDFFPFQLNPHYFNIRIEGHNGETRDQRLKEFLVLNPGTAVIGLPEGTALQLVNGVLTFIGSGSGVLLKHAPGKEPARRMIEPGADLSFLL